MKHWILKVISCVLTIAIFISSMELPLQMVVYADDSIIDYLMPDDAVREAQEECYNDVPEKQEIGIRLVF